MRPTLRASAAIVVRRRILLVRQEKAGTTYWLLPGGRVDRGESLEDTVTREVEEECCVRVAVRQPPMALVESISPDGGTRRHGIELVFAATPVSEPFIPRPGDPAIKEVRWVDAGELTSLCIHPPIADLILPWLELFADGLPETLPSLVSTGVRWLPE
jgi:8-oxo-dGTP diphosphatase